MGHVLLRKKKMKKDEEEDKLVKTIKSNKSFFCKDKITLNDFFTPRKSERNFNTEGAGNVTE